MMGAFSGMRICDTKAFSWFAKNSEDNNLTILDIVVTLGEAPLLPLNHLEIS